MPVQKRFRLHDQQRLLPVGCGSCQQQEFESITISESGAIALPLQNDQLLPQECILGDEFGLASVKVDGRTTCHGKATRFEPAFDVVLNNVEQSTK